MARPLEIDTAFASRPDLRKRIHAALDETPQHTSLLHDVSAYILDLKRGSSHQADELPAAKKRKLDAPEATTGLAVLTQAQQTTGLWRDVSAPVAWQNPEASFSIPQRKKFVLQLVATSPAGQGGIRALNASTGAVEFGVGWNEIEQVFCLPVPERAKRAHNFVVIPYNGDGVNPIPEGTTAAEPLVWTYEEPTGKALKEGEDPSPAGIASILNDHLAKVGRKVIFPSADHFVSEIVQSHRKSEKAYHVKAHRGSKDGFLFFTSVGIVWCFKKPIAFFSFATITSISYTSVLQRTFNLNISTTPPAPHKPLEIEFAMLDQEDYAGIDAYIKKHGLNDASMAAQRKAQKYNVNPTGQNGDAKGAAAAGAAAGVVGAGVADGEGDDEEENEIQKAERLLQDQEDEEEEDYDPGSEGDSDGSGSGSEDDEEEYDEEGEGEEDEEEEEEEGEGEGEDDAGQGAGEPMDDDEEGYGYEEEAAELPEE